MNLLNLFEDDSRTPNPNYAEELAYQIFKVAPGLDTTGAADEVLDYAFDLAVNDLGRKRAHSLFAYDADFDSDLVNAYLDLQMNQKSVAEGIPKNDKDEFKRQALLVKDRKTGKLYDPNKEFDKKMKSPEVMAQMKRMAAKEGVAEGSEQIYNILALDKGNALKKPTKLKWKASSLEDIFDALAAQDWYPLEINGVEVIAGKRLKQGVAEGQLNEYLLKAGMPVKDVLALNLFQDFDPVEGAAAQFAEFAEEPMWQQVVRKYAPIANMLKKKLLAQKRPLTDAEAEAVEQTWYDGSDAYDDMEIEYLIDIYDQQIDTLEALLAGNLTDEEFMEQGVAEDSLNELSPKTLGSYINKSTKDVGTLGYGLGDIKARPGKYKDSPDVVKSVKHSFNNRIKGVEKAADRLTKQQGVAEADPHKFDSDVDYYAAQNAPAKPRHRGQQSPGVNPDDEAYFREIWRKKREAAAKAAQDNGVDEARVGNRMSDMEVGSPKVVYKNGKAIGEIGIDRDPSPGNGPYYMKHYETNTWYSGYPTKKEALEDLKYVVHQTGEGLAEADKKKDDLEPEVKDVVLQRAISRAKADFPTAGSGIEALAKGFMRSQDEDQKSFDQLRQAERKQDQMLGQIAKIDQEQEQEIQGLEQQNSGLASRLQQLQNVNSELEKKLAAMSGRSAEKKSKTDTVTAPAIAPAAPSPELIKPKTKAKPKAKPQLTKSSMKSTAAQLAAPKADPMAAMTNRITKGDSSVIDKVSGQSALPFEPSDNVLEPTIPQRQQDPRFAAARRDASDVDPRYYADLTSKIAKKAIQDPEAAMQTYRVHEGDDEEQEADYDDKYQSMVARVGQKAREQEKSKPVDIADLARRLAAIEASKKD